MDFDLYRAAKEKLLIVAHRGSFAGNIPCNTIAAYEIALKQGADMIEIDVSMTRDGRLVIFHPGMETRHLGMTVSLPACDFETVRGFRYVNFDGTPTQFGIETLDDVLETFKGRCFINVDKFPDHPIEIMRAIERHGMCDQVLVKCAPKAQIIAMMQEVAPQIPYMPIVRNSHPMHEELMASGINYIGAEVLFAQEDAEVASDAFLARMHEDGKLVWANAIIYNHQKQLSAGHSDDTAVCSDPDLGWGWLARHGFDLIQTDWPLMLTSYLKENGLLYRGGCPGARTV